MLQGTKSLSGSAARAAEFVALGLDYSTGRGVPVDLVEAHKWLNLAAMDGNEEARRLRAEIARDMTAEEIADAQRRAREWRQAQIH
ncbi:MAG: SEL1-like repeat protein [Alphaproteobacteria bacterium]|nr:SEL1-like repeat protein [Alphaproteobacteria bacterium]